MVRAGPPPVRGPARTAHLKRILGLGRLRLRGPCGAKDEFTLAAIAQNLRKLAKLSPQMTEMEITARSEQAEEPGRRANARN